MKYKEAPNSTSVNLLERLASWSYTTVYHTLTRPKKCHFFGVITHLLVQCGVHHTFTRMTGGRSHIYSFAKPLSKLRILLISDERLTMSRKCWPVLPLAMSGGRSSH